VTEFPIKLLGDLIAVRPDKPDVQKIITPDWTRSLKGRVVSAGDGCHDLKGGETVVFGAVVGMETMVNNIPMRMMREENVDAVLE
jgi:co-chaperonin GroES (HSP10)